MDVRKLMEELASEINGQYSEYDDNRSVVIVPLPHGRFQSVRGGKIDNKKYGKSVIQILSRVCRTAEKIDYTKVLAHNVDLINSKFVVLGDFLMVETTLFDDTVPPQKLKEMILETAKLADEWELAITGKDVN
ncbi:MAG: hypothetical protein ACMVP2_02180 [Imperialibacter sp.]|uniref:hypothetical protein n=1 Tax=Imperialibacter sp. TaxID=2038411 RepID=UPI003A8AB62B